MKAPTGTAAHVLQRAVPLLAGGGCHGHSGRPRIPERNYDSDMLRGRWAGIAAALAIAATAVAAAGCGGGSTGSALQLDPVAAAATKTQNAGAAHVRMVMTVNGMGQRFGMRGSGAIDGKSAELNFKLGPTAGLMGPQLKHATIKEIVLERNGDSVLYLRAPALSAGAGLPGGKAWLKIDASKVGESSGLDFSKALSGSQLEPADMLAMLKAEGADVRTVGSSTIDGVATTHYRVKIDVAKALQSKGLSSPMLEDFASTMKTATGNVWIDQDGLVRRIQYAYAVPQAGIHMAMKMDLSDYGAHVTIAAPPSSQVFDMTQLAQQGLDSSH